jgi:hypothetical protein
MNEPKLSHILVLRKNRPEEVRVLEERDGKIAESR